MSAFSDHRAKISFRNALILWAIIVLGYLILLILFRNDQAFRATLADFFFPVFNGLTVLSLFYAAKFSERYGRRLYIAWIFMAFGQISFMLGDIVWAFLNYASHQNPFPSAADGFYLMYYPLFAAGIFLLPAAPLTIGDRLKFSLDTGIVMLLAILFFWIFLIEPIIAANQEDTLALAISLAYPVLDLALLFALLAFLFRPHQLAIQGPLLLLSGGVAIEIFTDTIYGSQALLGTFASGELLGLGWLASYALVGLAAVLQADSRKFDSSRPFYEFELQSKKLACLSHLPYICAFAAYLMLIWNHYQQTETSSFVLWGVGGIIGLVTIRQIIAISENMRLLANNQRQINERERTEEMLRESEGLFRTGFEVAPEVIFTISAKDGSLTSLNPAFERITGWSAAECLGRPFMEIIHPDDRSQAVSMFTQTLSGQNAEMHELRCLSKSGEYIIAEIIGVPQTRGGKIVGKLGFARDITERKRSVEALKKSEQSYRLLAETVTDVIWKMDMNLKYTYLSPSFERISGYSTEEGKGMSLEKIMTPESLKVIKQVFAEELENEKNPKKDLFRSRKIEVEEICKDGRTVWIEVNTTFIRDQEGRPIGIQGSSREITERKRTENALIESEAKYRTIFENTGNATLILDVDTTISLANTKSDEFFGYSGINVVGKKSWTEFIYKNDLDIMKKYHSLFEENGCRGSPKKL
jgi:PAS domain S-box-containing protein